jgi:hypothetical protein
MTVPGSVSAGLFDVSGRLVRQIVREVSMEAGEHDLVIDGRDDRGNRLATGVFFYRLETPEGIGQGRIVVAK